MRIRSMLICVSFLIPASFSVLPARDQGTPEKVELHGFGSWWYGNTSDNEYLGGLPEGSYENAEFSLNIAAALSDHLRVVAQVFLQEDAEEVETELDYAFAEWKFSDALRLRAGKVKLPFGISAEVFDVGTLRPFLRLPQAVYGPVGLLGESYKGAGLVGGHPIGHGWELRYDVYAGGMSVEEFEAPESFLRGQPIEEDEVTEDEVTSDLVGARVVFETPVVGLSFGASAYTGREIRSSRRTVYSGHVEYLTGDWSIRAEAAHAGVVDHLKMDARYLETAYRFGAHWQVALQMNYLATAMPDVRHPSAPSLQEHKEAAGGVNYWVSPAFVLKLSFHRVSGNRYALPDPEDLETVVTSGDLKTRTSLIMLGAQFSF